MKVSCKGIWNTTQLKFLLTYFLFKLLWGIYKFQLGHSFVYINMKNKQYFGCRDTIQYTTYQFIIALSL